MSLLRSPFYPDPFADRGKNTFSFSYGLTSNRDPIFYSEMGLKFNVNPVPVRSGGIIERHLLAENVVIGALKHAEEGTSRILRIYNPTSLERPFELELPVEISSAVEIDLLESPVPNSSTRDISQDGSVIKGKIGPFEIVSMRMTPKDPDKQAR